MAACLDFQYALNIIFSLACRNNLQTIRKERKMKRLALATIFLLLTVGTTKAATITYTDEAAFKSTLGSFTEYDFDNFVLNEGPDVCILSF